jgi:hypothetical protein
MGGGGRKITVLEASLGCTIAKAVVLRHGSKQTNKMLVIGQTQKGGYTV